MITAIKKRVRVARRWILAASCHLTGHQHALLPYLWSVVHKRQRDGRFSESGFGKFQLMAEDQWRALAAEVDRQITIAGKILDYNTDWSVNRRVSLDCSQQPLAAMLAEVQNGESFRREIDRICGGRNWRVTDVQIWRNYPEEYNDPGKEVNSTFYHVDNGGDLRHRLVLNVFCYLTPVAPVNGPFTFYTRDESRRINRRFIGEIYRRGNLRTHALVREIENFLPPHQLMLQPGEAAIIDNQVCLHRAGYCTEGHRDILQFLIHPVR